jgi:hypothetical protein
MGRFQVEREGKMRGWQGLLGVVFLLAWVTGCGGGAAARLDRGLMQEAEGRVLEAALSYISALERDSGLVEARHRLDDLGPLLAPTWDASIKEHLAEDDRRSAAETTLLMDEVVRRAPGVGTSIPLPTGWERQRRQMLDLGIESALDDAKGASDQGRWAEGIQAIDRATDRYQPTPEQARVLEDRRVDHLISWGEADLVGGRPRAALGRFDEALGRLGRGDARFGTAERGRARALEAGTVRVAFVPVMATQQATERSPRGFREGLTETLQFSWWATPPALVAPMDPLGVRRESDRVRLQQEARQSFDPLEVAVQVGRAVGADRVVLLEIEDFTQDTTNVRVQEREAPVRAGPGTGRQSAASGPTSATASYQIVTGTVRMAATSALLIVDPVQRRVVDRQRFTLRSQARLETGVYAGDPATLDLPTQTRILFNGSEQAVREAEAIATLQDELAERLAREAFDRLLARIP